MGDLARKASEEKLKEMQTRLLEIYSRAEREIGQSWTKYLRESGREIEGLQKAYDEAKRLGDKDKIRSAGIELSNAKKERTLYDRHYRALSQRTAMEIFHVNETAAAYINGQLPEIYTFGYNAISRQVDGIVDGYAFDLLDAQTVKNLATKDHSLLPYRKIDETKDVRWNTKKLNSEVLQGIVQGESMEEIAGRLKRVEQMNVSSAMRAARTSVTSAENEGRLDSYFQAQDDGVRLEKEWLATGWGNTRAWHLDLDGVTEKIEDPFINIEGEIMYPGDPAASYGNVFNCRCSLVADILGFEYI